MSSLSDATAPSATLDVQPAATPATGQAPRTRPAPATGQTAPLRRERRRPHAVPLLLAFAAVLFVFPSEVALAGPLKSNGSPARLIGLVALVLLALDLLRARRTRQAVAPPIVVLLLLYLAQGIFFYGWATLQGTGDPASATRELLFSASACGIALFAAARARTIATVHQVVGVVVAGCALSAVVALIQAVGVPLRWADVVTLPGFDQVASGGGGGERLGFRRVVGTATHPIEYGVVLGCCLPLALHLVLHAVTRRARAWAAVAAGLMAVALPFALSRGGIICIATALVVFLSVQPWRARIGTAIMGVVALCGAYVLAPGLAAAIVRLFADQADDPSIEGRTDDYPIVNAAFDASPWVGGSPTPEGLILDNQWLVLLVQRGLVGTAAFALLVLVPLAGLAAAAWRCRFADPQRASLAAAFAGALAALAVSGGIFDLLSFGQAAMFLYLLVGLSAAVVLPTRGAAAEGPHGRQGFARTTSTGAPERSSTLPGPSSTLLGAITAP